MSYGQSRSGSLGLLAETDTYRFDGQAEDIVRIRVSDGNPNGGSIDPLVELFDANGQSMGSQGTPEDRGVEALLQRTLPAAGSYFIHVQDVTANDTGSYQITLERLVNVAPRD